MSDVQQAPDWWLASDGKWYPPQPVAAAPPPQYAPAAAAPVSAAQPQSVVLLGGAAAVIVGAFLPWATVDFLGGSVSKSGTDGDGVITVVFGVAAAVLGAVSLGSARKRWQPIAALVVAALIAVIAVLDMVDIKSKFGDTSGFGLEVKIGIGLWLTLAGGLAALVGSILVLTKTPKATT